MAEQTDAKVEMKSQDSETNDVVKEEKKEEAQTDNAEGGHEKEKPTSESEEKVEITDLQKKIIRQVEYYFCDHALPKDKFLQEQMTLDDGWIPLTTMVKFKRLAELTVDHKEIISALKKSTSGLLEICEEKESIRRSKDKPLPEDTEEYRQLVKAKTVYCKGFPRAGTTIDKILEFFSGYDGVENVKMRYLNDKEEKSSVFKGSLSATFSSRDLAEKFMNLDEVKYNDQVLFRQWFVDWEKEKEEQFNKKKNKHSKKSGENTDGKNGESKENEKIKLAKGAILKLQNLPEKVDRDEIKKSFASYPADIAHVEGPIDNTAFVRLRGENDGKTVLSKLESGKIKVNDTDVEVSLLEGEEEEEYLKKVEERINSAKAGKGNHGRFGGRGRGRGRGRGGWRGHKRSGSPGNDHGNKKSRRD